MSSRQKEIIVDVMPDGSVKIDAQCFTGTECAKATKFIEDALGTPKSSVKKPEYHKQAKQQKQINQ